MYDNVNKYKKWFNLDSTTEVHPTNIHEFRPSHQVISNEPRKLFDSLPDEGHLPLDNQFYPNVFLQPITCIWHFLNKEHVVIYGHLIMNCFRTHFHHLNSPR